MGSFRVNFSVPELQQALNQISAYDGKSAAKIEDAVSKATKNISKGAKQRVSVNTGALKKSINSRFDKKTVTGYVGAKKPYAHLVEFGAKAAIVRPGPGTKVLTIDEFGLRRYATKANIPARAEHPFLRPAFESEKPTLIREITQAVRP